MNDYLSNLITRNLSQEDVILPRPSSLYETAVPATDPVHSEEESTANIQPQTAAPAPTIAVTAPPTIRPEPEPMPVKQSPDVQQTTTTPHMPSLPSWLERLRSLTQQPPATAEPVSPIEDEINIRPAPKPMLLQPSSSISARSNTVPAAAPEPKKAKSQIEPKPQEIIERQFSTTKLFERIEHTPVISETIITREKVPAIVSAASQSPRNKEARSAQSAAPKIIKTETRPYQPPIQPQPAPNRRDEPTPPAVHVTIGRVEVRATKSTPTVSPRRLQQTKSSVMSLDDYLRQRANGENR